MFPRNQVLGLLLALLCAGSMWFYVQRILIPYQKADAAAHDQPRGNFSDLYPRWLGARELLLHHRNPYSAEVTQEIQTGYYGRPLDPSRPHDPKDEQAFAYPVFVVFLLAPFVSVPFSIVQNIFIALLFALAIVTVWLWLRSIHWRPPLLTTVILLTLTLGSFPLIQGIKLQQLSLLVSGTLAAAAVSIAGGYFFVAGVLVGLATIKPQLTLPLAGWFLLWSSGDWKRRQRFVWGFTFTMIVLLAGSELLLPGWVKQFVQAVAAYRDYTAGAGSLLDVMVTPTIGHILTLVFILFTILVGWKSRQETEESSTFVFVAALVLTVTVVIVPKVSPYNQVLLLPGIFLLLHDWGGAWRQPRLARWLSILGSAIVGWPWLASITLMILSFFLPPDRVQQAWVLPIRTSLEIPLIVLALLALRGLHSRTATR